jgi:YHS domain-containing protein
MIRTLSLWILAALMGTASVAAEPVSTHWLTGAAIGGKDAVSYYEPANQKIHKEADGSSKFAVQHLGHAWRFASQASADRFAANPSAYVPQYNGFCSNALASDEGLINTNGEVWEFFGDKLHLFYAERGRQRWLNGDWQAYKKEADKAWQGLTTGSR